ncbi:MAG: DUF1559 domain-containing protein [Planctomycetes bacterium]|nr:DUF1559 domain-containing protein [Planctomycetota bacterium]
MPPPSDRCRASTLVELLVVAAIVALLVGMLVPALGAARTRAKAITCASNLAQIGLAVIAYAGDHRDAVPRGAICAGPFDFSCADLATNQLWIGAANPFHRLEYNGAGALLKQHAASREVFYCPADDSSDAEEELPRVGTEHDAYGSYLYRQVDFVPAARRRGLLTDLGVNVVGGRRVRVEALALDMNSLGPPELNLRRTNHAGREVNVLFRDRSVRAIPNRGGIFSLPAEVFSTLDQIPRALDQVLLNADFAYQHSPGQAPRLGP